MKKFISIIALLISLSVTANAAGTLTQVYLNPNVGNDSNSGSVTISPVQSWDKAISLAANNATIYITGGAVAIASNMTINGNQYGATDITVMPNTGYTGALFAIASGSTGTFSNLILKGPGTAQALLSVNSGGNLSIGANVKIIDNGRIALDGGANAINLTATPAIGTEYPLLTTYQSATDEGRAIVNAGSVSNPRQYFTLIEPETTSEVEYRLLTDGTTIRLHELPIGGIYFDPISGNDSYSGAKSNRPVKTLAKAKALWYSRNTEVPGIITDIFVLSSITLTENTTLDGGIKLTRFIGDTDNATGMLGNLIIYTGFELTLEDITIESLTSPVLYSASNGILNLNNGATINAERGNPSSPIISSSSNGKITLHPGSTITQTNPGYNSEWYCISGQNTDITINGGTINATYSAIFKEGGVLTINGGTINHDANICINNNTTFGSMIINGGTINTASIRTNGGAIINSNSLTINGGIITNTSPLINTGYTITGNGDFTMNGGTINAGSTAAISTLNYITLNKCNITSSNTATGAVSATQLRINGQEAVIDGIIAIARADLELNYITITSSTVTHNYNIRIMDNSSYSALVRSNPAVDLGPYLSKFTLEPKAGYELTAHANKGGSVRNIFLYNPNGIYVNDFTGNDSNSGTSPSSPVKTLANAATKTSSTKTLIYICDSTLTINNIQNINRPAIRDTITSFAFRNNANLISVVGGGSLTLRNIAIYTTSRLIGGYIRMEPGSSVTLDSGAEIMTNDRNGIMQYGGDLTMKAGSIIKHNPTNGRSTGTGVYGIRQYGNTATATLKSGFIIENISSGIYATDAVTIEDDVLIQGFSRGVDVRDGGTVNIGRAFMENGRRSASDDFVISVNNGTANLNGTIIQNNQHNGVLNMTGSNSVVNMTDGEIINNQIFTNYEGSVLIQNGATFNFSGGLIGLNNEMSNANNTARGEQIIITSGGRMNFTGGKVVGNHANRNAIYIEATNTNVGAAGHLSISKNAIFEDGFIYCSSQYFAPISLTESLDASQIYNINLGDNMAGSVLVDGSSIAASVNNFVLNPALITLSLSQSGNNVIVGSTAIYLNGASGSDVNDGSTSVLAVRTFKRARERLSATGGNYIIVVGEVRMNNTDEISDWDLSFNPNAVVMRGLGYTGILVNIPFGRHLTLSNITLDGNENMNSGSAIIRSDGTLTINNGAVIRNNATVGVQSNSGGKVYMNGGVITKNRTYGISLLYGVLTDSLVITGGSITENVTGIYASEGPRRHISITGGEISKNSGSGITGCSNIKIGGTAKINENGSSGISSPNLDTLIIEGGQINNNGFCGVYATGTCQYAMITGGEIKNNTGFGIYLNNSSGNFGSIINLSDVEITGNGEYGANLRYFNTCSIIRATINNNITYGLSIIGFSDMFVKDTEVKNNGSYGMSINSGTISPNNILNIESSNIEENDFYGIVIAGNTTYSISENTTIIDNKGIGISSNATLPSSISNVLIKGNGANTIGSGIMIGSNGTVNISDVTLEGNRAPSGGGGISVGTNCVVNLSNVKIENCISDGPGSAISSAGTLNMTGGHIIGCDAAGNGTISVTSGGNIRLTGVNINNNTARMGGVAYIAAGGQITLDSDTIKNNTTTTANTSGEFHIAAATGRLILRDNCDIEGVFYLSTNSVIHIDEPLMSASLGKFKIFAQTPISAGRVVVSPNGTTVDDASQFLPYFTLVNPGGSGLDKGGTDYKHIMIVNQYFIDGTKPGGNGTSPPNAFNNIAQLIASGAFNNNYTTIWVSGPVTTTGNDVIPSIARSDVNIRRYTGFSVAAQPYPAYDSVMFTIDPGATLTVTGGNNATNNLTISGEGGSSFTDASIFKNNGTLTIGGFTTLLDNPTGGPGSAIYQNGTFNMSGSVEFDVQSTNTVYLTDGKVINITGPLNSTMPIGITVETSPANTHISGRVIATGTTTNIAAGKDSLFVNEITTNPLPIGRRVTGSVADIMFYIADRNVAGTPVYATLQGAFDAAVSASNDEVRLYANTQESVVIDKRLRYNSNGHAVLGSFTLDSASVVQLLDDLHADTLYIRATTFARKAQIDLNGFDASVTKAAYLDLRLPENSIAGNWYPFNLPFESKVADIRNAADTTYAPDVMSDYAIAEYSGQRRANFGIGNLPSNPDNDWQYFTGADMNEGTGYMVTTSGIQTLRFKASNLNLFNIQTVPVVYYSGAAGSMHQGMNYVAQPMGINSTISGGVTGIIQASKDFSSDRIGAASYVAEAVNSSLVIAPYTNYFHQTLTSGTASYTKTSNVATVRSASAEVITTSSSYSSSSSETPLYYELRLQGDNPEQYDNFFAAASEYASEDKYEIGRDVIKMGTVGNAMQLWSMDFDVELCANEVTLKNGTADIPLFINTPVAGKEYKLNLRNVVSFSEQLWLCRDGKLVQNLTLYPEYTIEGVGGIMTEYSLRLVTGTTSNKAVEASDIYVYTENGQIVISNLTVGDEYAIYDASGRLFAKEKANNNREKVYAGAGFYVIQINGKTYKAVVK